MNDFSHRSEGVEERTLFIKEGVSLRKNVEDYPPSGLRPFLGV